MTASNRLMPAACPTAKSPEGLWDQTFSSPHPGVNVVLFADGHVQVLDASVAHGQPIDLELAEHDSHPVPLRSGIHRHRGVEIMEMLHQTLLASLWGPVRRLKLAAACVAFVLLLLVAGLSLLARTPTSDSPSAGTQEQGQLAALANLSQDQDGCPAKSLQAILAHPDIIPSHRHPLLGQQAPHFELADSEGKVRSLVELQDGRPVVLIFYYGCHCVACLRHLFEINRELPLFHAVGGRVVAISGDPPASTRQWCQQHGSFGFTLLSDPGNQVAQAYRVLKPETDCLRHGTFVIDGQGTIQWVNVGDAPFRRNPALLYQLAKIDGQLSSAQPGR